MSPLLTRTIEALLLPPGGLLLLLVVGLAVWSRHRRSGQGLAIAAVAGLYLGATPIVAQTLMNLLERVPPASVSEAAGAQAIVVLGGGRYADAPEYGGDTVSRWTLERLRYGARLHRETGRPLLVSGGTVFGGRDAEALLMQRVLEEEFGVKVRWLEDQSRTTWENARHSATLLGAEAIERIYLVTHAWHMPRAAAAFGRTGLAVVPAPTGYTRISNESHRALNWLPSAEAFYLTRHASHELVGRLWYALLR